jgi:hypothetical protein
MNLNELVKELAELQKEGKGHYKIVDQECSDEENTMVNVSDYYKQIYIGLQ